MSKKRRSENHEHLKFLEQTLHLNGQALVEGPTKKKTWSIHDLKSIQPLTENQRLMFEGFSEGYNLFAHGSAGTGKTYLALYLALSEVLRLEKKQQTKIIIVRSAVPSRDSGFLPGTYEEKMAIYEAPYKDICADLIGRQSTYDNMKEAGLIEFQSTSYLRGLTWDDTIVIIDEIQSMTWHELNTVITRLGKNARLMVIGDRAQNDLVYKRNELTGIESAFKVIDRLSNDFWQINFKPDDICRSRFVKAWILACEEVGV